MAAAFIGQVIMYRHRSPSPMHPYCASRMSMSPIPSNNLSSTNHNEGRPSLHHSFPVHHLSHSSSQPRNGSYHTHHNPTSHSGSFDTTTITRKANLSNVLSTQFFGDSLIYLTPIHYCSRTEQSKIKQSNDPFLPRFK